MIIEITWKNLINRIMNRCQHRTEVIETKVYE